MLNKTDEVDLRLKNTQDTYDVDRFAVPQGSFLYDTYKYYQALSQYYHGQINVIEDVQNFLVLKQSGAGNDDPTIKYERLHVANSYWKLRRDEALLIQAGDRLNVTRALYQQQTFLNNKTNVEEYLEKKRTNTEDESLELNDDKKKALMEGDTLGYTPGLEVKYNGTVLLSQYKLSYTREFRI